MHWNPFSIFFPPPLLKPGPLLKPFSSVLSFPHFPFCFPLIRLALLPSCSSTQVVSQRFPQNSIGAVGSAMFLRFVNPAIVSPYEAGILDKKPLPRIERGLKLMSKVRLVTSICAETKTKSWGMGEMKARTWHLDILLNSWALSLPRLLNLIMK